jgi:hypothetical protein
MLFASASVRDGRAWARKGKRGLHAHRNGADKPRSQVAALGRPSRFYERLARLPFLLIAWIICK